MAMSCLGSPQYLTGNLVELVLEYQHAHVRINMYCKTLRSDHAISYNGVFFLSV